MKYIRQTGTTHNEFGAGRHIAGFVERAGECIAFCLDEAVTPADEELTAAGYGERLAEIASRNAIEAAPGFVAGELEVEVKRNLDLRAVQRQAEGRLADVSALSPAVQAQVTSGLENEVAAAGVRHAESTTRVEALSAELAVLTP